MSYIGAEPTTAAFPFDQFSGTGATTAFALTQAPAGNTSVIVYVGGAVQNPNTYTIVGTTITFSVAPVAGTNNIGVLLLGLPALVGVPNVGTVTPAMLSTGGPSWNTGGTLSATTFSGAGTSLTGTAASLTIGGSAATLTTGRTVALTGDVTYTSPAFNGSANVTAAATLANSGVTAGTYGSASVIPSVTVDAKGRVTSITTNAVAGGVTSVNGQTGAVVTTDLFSIGSTVTGRPANVTTYAVNATIAGTSLYSTTPTEAYSGGFTVATATLINTGTWRCMSIAPNGPGSAGYAGVWARIS